MFDYSYLIISAHAARIRTQNQVVASILLASSILLKLRRKLANEIYSCKVFVNLMLQLFKSCHYTFIVIVHMCIHQAEADYSGR